MTVNVLGPITVTYAVFNSMREHNKGVIINVASRAGVVTGAMSSAYSCSKAALIRATGNIQQECNQEGKDGISLFSLHPGGVKTSMNDRILITIIVTN
jgi:short-subunit dehydrogenase